jgi:hypothetical protein
MDKLFIDFVGPLTRTKRGNIAILVIVDGFSKFVSFYPVKRVSSGVVVECLERAYFPAYGKPQSIVTDNASVFRCKQVRDLCFLWGIAHQTTTPYYPQASLEERVIRNLKAALKIFHYGSQATWDEDLAWLRLGFNTAVHESTKSTPDRLFLGRELKCPLIARWDLTTVHDGTEDLTRQRFWTKAYENLMVAKRKAAQRYNQNRRAHSFRVGDVVMYRLHNVSSKARNVSANLLVKWSTPVVIVKFARPNVVLLANRETGVSVRRAHVSQLKPFAE